MADEPDFFLHGSDQRGGEKFRAKPKKIKKKIRIVSWTKMTEDMTLKKNLLVDRRRLSSAFRPVVRKCLSHMSNSVKQWQQMALRLIFSGALFLLDATSE